MTDDPHQHDLESVPWAMQFAVLVPRDAPPSRTHVTEAALSAGALLLADQRSAPGGPWHEAVTTWHDVRIRKVVRRGRGAPFDRACEEEGVTVTVGSATVRAFVPSQSSEVPVHISRLQVSGTDLEDVDERTLVTPRADWPGVVVAVSPLVRMTALKTAAQVAHCGTVAWLKMSGGRRDAWVAAGCPALTMFPSEPAWASFAAGADVTINDAGFTEVAPGSHTVSARWTTPWFAG